jgi:hypothetical protein
MLLLVLLHMPISSLDATRYRLRDAITVGDDASAEKKQNDRRASRTGRMAKRENKP